MSTSGVLETETVNDTIQNFSQRCVTTLKSLGLQLELNISIQLSLCKKEN